ncbi:MAG: hemolysin family protein [Bdellovibrionales bacterium]
MKTRTALMTTETPPDPDPEESQRFTERMTGWLKNLATRRKEEDLHDALAELMEEQPTGGAQASEPEYQLLQNILELRERTVADCMCPRADIVAVDATMDFDALVTFVNKEAHSRYPVFRENLDDVIGIVILKDVMAALAEKRAPAVDELIRDVLFVPTSMPVMRLLLQMRQKRHHLAMVVDEYGGVDGLVTIEDLVEQIVGEIEDEHDENDYASPVVKADGSLIVDGRMPLEKLEEHLGVFLTTDERNNLDTVNGLALSLAGTVPSRGSQFTHSSGMLFEVAEADTRRVKRLRVRKP